jgi:hypothetical protein
MCSNVIIYSVNIEKIIAPKRTKRYQRRLTFIISLMNHLPQFMSRHSQQEDLINS